MLEIGDGIVTIDEDFTEGCHIEQADTFTNSQLLIALVVEPVLPLLEILYSRSWPSRAK